MPEQDAVLAMTSGAQNMQAILDAAWRTLLPAMAEAPKVVKKHQADLRRALRGLRLDPPGFRDDPPAAAHLDGTSWRLEANEPGLRAVSFAFHAGRLVMTIQARRKTVVRCGAGKWVSGRMRRDRNPPPVPDPRAPTPGPVAVPWRRPCAPSPPPSGRRTSPGSRQVRWRWS